MLLSFFNPVSQRGQQIHGHLQPGSPDAAAGSLERLLAISHPNAQQLPSRQLGYEVQTSGASTNCLIN